jgi:hypothetical protein
VAIGVSRGGVSRPDPARPETHGRPHPGPRWHSRTGRNALTGHKTPSGFARYNIVSGTDPVLARGLRQSWAKTVDPYAHDCAPIRRKLAHLTHAHDVVTMTTWHAMLSARAS